jgi:hypothetical protein
MKRLSKLDLRSDIILDSRIRQLIRNSPKLKAIVINDRHINETTIEAFVEKALKRQKSCYKFIDHQFYNRKRVYIKTILKNLFIKKNYYNFVLYLNYVLNLLFLNSINI